MQRLSSIIPNKEIYPTFAEIDLHQLIHSYGIDLHHPVNVILNRESKIETGIWGLNPSSKREDIHLPYVEYDRAHLKPTFRMVFRENKGIAIMDSFYAWNARERVPYRICLESGAIFWVPMIYFKLPDDRVSFTMLVREAQQDLANITEVEPLSFSREEVMTWLGNPPVEEAIHLLRSNEPAEYRSSRTSNKAMIAGFDDKILHQTSTNSSSEEPSLFG